VVDVIPVGPKLTVLWALMITSAANRGWPGDVPLLERHDECGLPVPSVIRTEKIATLDARLATKVGALPADLWSEVRRLIASRLASWVP